MNKLIPLSEYVLQRVNKVTALQLANDVVSYTKFLRQPLTLGMFVPAHGNVVLTEPLREQFKTDSEYYDRLSVWNEAAEKVLFNVEAKMGKCNGEQAIYIPGKPAQIVSDFSWLTIEDITHWGFELTPSALKMIGKE